MWTYNGCEVHVRNVADASTSIRQETPGRITAHLRCFLAVSGSPSSRGDARPLPSAPAAPEHDDPPDDIMPSTLPPRPSCPMNLTSGDTGRGWGAVAAEMDGEATNRLDVVVGRVSPPARLENDELEPTKFAFAALRKMLASDEAASTCHAKCLSLISTRQDAICEPPRFAASSQRRTAKIIIECKHDFSITLYLSSSKILMLQILLQLTLRLHDSSRCDRQR
jgi:hypothetical protein